MNTAQLLELTPVESSNIEAVGFGPVGDVAPGLGILQVRFANQAIWNYYNVPESVYVELLAAESVGRYFAANVRGKFNDQQVGLAGAQPTPQDVEDES